MLLQFIRIVVQFLNLNEKVFSFKFSRRCFGRPDMQNAQNKKGVKKML